MFWDGGSLRQAGVSSRQLGGGHELGRRGQLGGCDQLGGRGQLGGSDQLFAHRVQLFEAALDVLTICLQSFQPAHNISLNMLPQLYDA